MSKQETEPHALTADPEGELEAMARAHNPDEWNWIDKQGDTLAGRSVRHRCIAAMRAALTASTYPARVAELEAEVERLRKAAETFAEFHRRVQESLGEAVHTGLRKGVDGKGSHAAWTAISNMTDNGWSEAISFARYGLEYGLESRLAEARAALSPEDHGAGQ